MQSQTVPSPSPSLNQQQILSAFTIMQNPQNSKQLIKEADMYLRECQQNCEFALMLMIIFDKAASTQKWQILIHLNNVIKRNWTTKRRVHEVSIPMQVKDKIKNGLVQLYRMYWNGYYKEFNQIFRFLAKYEFPANYPSLKNFTLQILTTLANSQLQSIITPPQLLPYLSLIKTLYKQNSRKITHTKQSYLQHIVQPLSISIKIYEKITNALKQFPTTLVQKQNIQACNKLLECSRKIDKIMLYCILATVTVLQADRLIQDVMFVLVGKIEFLVGLRVRLPGLNQQIQKNIHAIVELGSKVQTMFPFIFTNFLQKYLQTILSLLISQSFSNLQLQKSILISNTKPFTTTAYYLTQSQFKQSNECKRGSGLTFRNEQQLCHKAYMTIYGNYNATSFMEKAILELMDKYAREEDQMEGMFQDIQCNDGTQGGVFQLLVNLLRNLMIRFKEEFRGFSQKLFQHLVGNKLAGYSSKVANNMYQIILLLPRIYDEQHLKIDKIFTLMQICYVQSDFNTFSRLIRTYNPYFPPTTTQKSFHLLLQIITTPGINHKILYQCASSIKKILSEHQEQGLPIQKLGLCLKNLLTLVSIYKSTPAYLWNILLLISDILKIVSQDVVVANLEFVLSGLEGIIGERDNDQIVVSAISDLLQNILDVLPSDSSNYNPLVQYLFQISISLVGSNIQNPKIETPTTLYRLWLAVIKNVDVTKNSPQFVKKLLNGLKQMKNKIISEDAVLFLQITQEYVLAGVLQLNADGILSLADEVLGVGEEQNGRVYMAFFSLYFTLFCLKKIYVPKILQLAMTEVCNLQNKLSQHINLLRTFLILIINQHIIEIGPQQIFNMFTQFYANNYMQWFAPYLWSLQYLSNKYSCKLTSIALLTSLDLLTATGILMVEVQHVLPLLKIMKIISFQVQPITMASATNSYMNSFKMMLQSEQRSSRSKVLYYAKTIPRKYKLHLKQQWAQCDLTEMYRNKFIAIMNSLGWTFEHIDQKMDKMAASRIIGILGGVDETGSNSGGSKGSSKKKDTQ